MEETKNTKEMIEQAALDMFSKRGYHAVSIRDIGKAVGIKESSIYYHFKNKQAIMDSLLDKIVIVTQNMKESFGNAFSRITDVPEDAMCAVAVGVLENYLMNPYVYKMIQMLSIERMADERADEMYLRIVFELPLKQQEEIFRQMIERSFIRDCDVKVLAQEYYSVIYFAFQKNCLGCQVTEVNKRTACEEINRNMQDIYRKMK
jgi:AcrR family transcriptional regulator